MGLQFKKKSGIVYPINQFALIHVKKRNVTDYRKENVMKLHMNESNAKAVGMYDPRFEHDNCGIGAVVNIKGVKTHQTVENALKIVENLKHRAGKDAEGKTGDGVGILLQISHRFFSKTMKSLGVFLGEERDYGIGMFFFPQDELKRNQAKKMFEVIIEKEGLELLAWREVPTDPTVIGQKAVDCMPYIMQAFIKRPDDVEKGLDFDRRLYVARRVFEQSNDNTYVVSLSSRTIVYKGMFLVNELRLFFKDLQDPDYESALQWFIPDSLQIQIRAGSVHIRTALWYIMVRSIRSRVTPIRCWPARRPWSLSI